jgi:hypothetical protein
MKHEHEASLETPAEVAGDPARVPRARIKKADNPNADNRVASDRAWHSRSISLTYWGHNH